MLRVRQEFVEPSVKVLSVALSSAMIRADRDTFFIETKTGHRAAESQR